MEKLQYVPGKLDVRGVVGACPERPEKASLLSPRFCSGRNGNLSQGCKLLKYCRPVPTHTEPVNKG